MKKALLLLMLSGNILITHEAMASSERKEKKEEKESKEIQEELVEGLPVVPQRYKEQLSAWFMKNWQLCELLTSDKQLIENNPLTMDQDVREKMGFDSKAAKIPVANHFINTHIKTPTGTLVIIDASYLSKSKNFIAGVFGRDYETKLAQDDYKNLAKIQPAIPTDTSNYLVINDSIPLLENESLPKAASSMLENLMHKYKKKTYKEYTHDPIYCPRTLQSISAMFASQCMEQYINMILGTESEIRICPHYLVHIPFRPTELSDKNYFVIADIPDNLSAVTYLKKSEIDTLKDLILNCDLFEASESNLARGKNGKLYILHIEFPNNTPPTDVVKMSNEKKNKHNQSEGLKSLNNFIKTVKIID